MGPSYLSRGGWSDLRAGDEGELFGVWVASLAAFCSVDDRRFMAFSGEPGCFYYNTKFV